MNVKICGITEFEDALYAAELGANALGFIFAASPRQISPQKARDIVEELPPFVKTVGVFVNENAAAIRTLFEYCGLDLVQLHGDESPQFCRDFMPCAIKALRMRGDSNLPTAAQFRGNVRALLLDTYVKDKAGGTGKTFDWNLAVNIKEVGIPVVLSGGLNPSNIVEAIETVKPYAVDVNSGVEEHPGKKSHLKMKELMVEVRRINRAAAHID